MGNRYTTEERIEFEHYKKLIDKAIEEKERWIQYKQVKKTLDKNLREKKRLYN